MDCVLVDLFCGDARGHEGLHGVDDLRTTAVVERDAELEPVVVCGHLLALAQPVAARIGHTRVVEVTEEAEPHADALEALALLLAQQPLLEAHEEGHLGGLALPVLRGEGVHRQPLHAECEAAVHHRIHRVLGGLVADTAGEVAHLRPAPVAVHDAGDVPGDLTLGDQRHLGRLDDTHGT